MVARAAELAPGAAALRRALGFRDVVLFLVVAVVGTRWIAAAASLGPSAIAVWLIALIAFFLPLAFTVVELSSRYPEEGGLYVWTRRAFGDRAGFLAAWMYWASCLVYFPGLLYFAAGNALFLAGSRGVALAASAPYFIAASLLGLMLALLPNLLGVGLGKWLHNAGALVSWLPVTALVAMGLASASRFGPATRFSPSALLPSASFKDVALWSAIAFAFGGLEASSFMAGEVVEARRTVPRAILVAGGLITAIYLGGTVAILLALPAREASGLQGIMQAIERAGSKLGWHGVAPVSAALLTFGAVAMAGAWLAATARLPFVAGVDRFLPAAFGRLHPRWGTPHVALLTQAACTAVFALLGQVGTTVKGAYDALISMGVITYFIPFLLMFAAMIRLQREPAAPGVMRVPGGRPVAIALAGIGLATTAASIAIAVIPPADAPRPALAVLKVVGASLALAIAGLLVYRASPSARASSR